MAESKAIEGIRRRYPGPSLNSYIEEWKNQGKKVLGYNCSYFPEEIVHAAGLLPFRIRGTGCTETTLADSFLARANCSFARACLEHLLQGRYDFLDSAVFVYSCDHMCTAHNSWKAQGKLPLIENIISVPHTITEYGREWYREEIGNIKDRIEEHFDVTITDDGLKEAIIACNETQRLQKRLYELREKKCPTDHGQPESQRPGRRQLDAQGRVQPASESIDGRARGR